ncbi:sorting nexin-10A [Takifugu flavidus]|uniref:sorting nexin-10A n=1 Tax=Takifugu flavidus TaxID=433684 RepID=UPI0025445A3F|nr:sorting nexin-10A [Takifugu flavidus]XP_056876539.1 sorting nexin-10A [Takifugu flavidus]
MDSMLDKLAENEFISVCVGNPRLIKKDHWRSYVDYEISLHTNSMCFRKKTSTVRRRYKEFVWLRNSLEKNALIIEIPKLPPWNPFFSLRNMGCVLQRMEGMQEFLENVLHTPLLLSDSRLHLFLQSDLSVMKIERCAVGRSRYTVAEAIQRTGTSCVSLLEEKRSGGFDCESLSSGLGGSIDGSSQGSPHSFLESSDREPELCSGLSGSLCTLTDNS